MGPSNIIVKFSLITCDSYLAWQITLRMLSVISQFLCHLSYYEYIRKDYITTLISIIFLISAFASYCYIVLLCGAHYNI